MFYGVPLWTVSGKDVRRNEPLGPRRKVSQTRRLRSLDPLCLKRKRFLESKPQESPHGDRNVGKNWMQWTGHVTVWIQRRLIRHAGPRNFPCKLFKKSWNCQPSWVTLTLNEGEMSSFSFFSLHWNIIIWPLTNQDALWSNLFCDLLCFDVLLHGKRFQWPTHPGSFPLWKTLDTLLLNDELEQLAEIWFIFLSLSLSRAIKTLSVRVVHSQNGAAPTTHALCLIWSLRATGIEWKPGIQMEMSTLAAKTSLAYLPLLLLLLLCFLSHNALLPQRCKKRSVLATWTITNNVYLCRGVYDELAVATSKMYQSPWKGHPKTMVLLS